MKPTRSVRESRGALLPEALMAVAIATATLVGVAQLLVLLSQQNRSFQRRRVAVREAGNLMEDLASRPWDEISADAFSAGTLSDECSKELPDSRLRIDVFESDSPKRKRILISIDWSGSAARRVAPVRLVAWRFRSREP